MANPISRRRALWLTGGIVALPAAGYGLWEAVRPVSSATGSTQAPPETVQATGIAGSSDKMSFVHVIAHPDDNLYFMNPDLDQSVATGAACVTVCLTDGESDGRNVLYSEAGRKHVPSDRADYTRARINGLAASYAVMATGDEKSPWDIQLVSYHQGLAVEQHTLRAAPHVQLIFPGIVEARAVSIPRKDSLRGLWLGEEQRISTLPPARSKLPAGATYTRDQVIDTLVAVLDHYRPTVVRTLDPNPDHATKAPPKGQGLLYFDHQDHTYSAYFTQAALAKHWGDGKARPATVESYLGYVNAELPPNLDQPTVERKAKLIDTYGWADNRNCGDPAGCGDRKVGGGAMRNGWAQSTRYRAPGSGQWLQQTSDGRLAAFALLNGAAACWVEDAKGWHGPQKIAGDGLEGQLQVIRQSDGRLRLFGVRTVLGFTENDHRREIVSCLQNPGAPGAPLTFGAWQSLGAPDGNDAVKSMEFGYPVALALPGGGIQIFARTFDGTVAVRTLEGGWNALPLPPGVGKGVLDGLGAVLDASGLTQVFAGGKSVAQWCSDTPGGPLRPAAPTGLPTPSGPISALLTKDGALRLYYREPKSAKVLTAERQPGADSWKITAESTPPGGFGRVSATADTLAVRDAKGRVALSTGNDWQHAGPLLAHTPSVATDRDGLTVAVALGCDGLLYAARRAAGDGPFGAWTGVS
ncbi:PIG-L family deacetylase [Kitasatospora sp. GP82]|uniref:PIG-L family deacetylase n=1 Tax=Kitasatospora sp. GP82 TaxID=3035089 RepID=UPI00247424A3|nr:PIG-L family deacetylase [Kitasatospora sp. GP82]MDH6128701.1 LmbE family N-acetylglucosaminyl deacetylase [Kitasatospora sp. GP82]